MTGVFSQNTTEKIIFLDNPNKLYLTQYDRRYKTFGLKIRHFGSFWTMFQIRHIFIIFNFDLRFLWFLVGLEGSHQSKKTRKLLICSKCRKHIFGKIADMAFWIVADDY